MCSQLSGGPASSMGTQPMTVHSQHIVDSIGCAGMYYCISRYYLQLELWSAPRVPDFDNRLRYQILVTVCVLRF